MSEFDALMAEADEVIWETFGSAAVCTSRSGTRFETDVVVNRDMQSQGADGEIQVNQVHIEMPKPTVEFGEGSRIEADGSAFRVVRKLADDGVEVTYLVKLDSVQGW